MEQITAPAVSRRTAASTDRTDANLAAVVVDSRREVDGSDTRAIRPRRARRRVG